MPQILDCSNMERTQSVSDLSVWNWRSIVEQPNISVFVRDARHGSPLSIVIIVIAALLSWLSAPAFGQNQEPAPPTASSRLIQKTVKGAVMDAAGNPVSDALVRMSASASSDFIETRTDSAGAFVFSDLHPGSYTLSARKSELHSSTESITVSAALNAKLVRLVLHESPSPLSAMEFADKPNFTVAGVVDWTAVGGHGSDSSLRTSEDLARETLTLKPEASETASEVSASEEQLRKALSADPKSFQTNRQLGVFYLRAGRYRDSIAPLEAAHKIDAVNHDDAYDLAYALKQVGDLPQARVLIQELLAQRGNAADFRLAGELDEKLNDPLTAVHELEQAARLDPSEQNYFELGSEFLLHRAIWQAQEVFRQGSTANPKSARMLTALGTALFAGAHYDDAAASLCKASDLNPADPEPYLFMGKVEVAAPNSLECIESRLARFALQQPKNSQAIYLYAMALWKRQSQAPDPQVLQQVESLLTKAVNIDAKCSDGYLQLGILRSSQRDFAGAIVFYTKAIESNPQLGEAHYRLGVAYDRIGESARAKQEFQLHDQIEKQQAAAIEEQRREVKQFQFAPQSQPIPPPSH